MSISVFISYSSKDLHHVDKIKETIESSEVRLFVAEYSLKPGQSLSENIIKEIKNCNVFILVWSKNSKESGWVPLECGIARGQNKSIIPIVLDENVPLPDLLKDFKYITLNDSYEDCLLLLKNVIQKQIDNSKFALKDFFVLAGIFGLIFLLSKD